MSFWSEILVQRYINAVKCLVRQFRTELHASPNF